VRERLYPVCPHIKVPKSRALEGTWVTDEVYKALEKGYKMLEIFEVWHYPNTSCFADGDEEDRVLFTKYINTFAKVKTEASGWPSWVNHDDETGDEITDEEEIDRRKDRFILEYEEREGIKLNPEKISKNAGIRELAKLMLNSFWGQLQFVLVLTVNRLANAHLAPLGVSSRLAF